MKEADKDVVPVNDIPAQRDLLAEMLRTVDLDAADFDDVEDAMQALLQRTKELRAGEERLRIVADHTYDWEYWVLPGGCLEYCSPSCKRITGYDAQEFMIDPGLLDRIVHPEDAHVWREHRRAATEELEHLRTIFRIIDRNGEEVWISHHCRAIFDENGQYRGRRASNRDISSRKQAEAELRQKSEETFKNIIQALPMGIYLYQLRVDDALIFMGANPAADRLLGIDHTAFVGKTIEQAFPPLQTTEIPDRYRRTARHGENWHTENIEYDHNGIAGAFEAHAFQMSPGNVAVLFSDIKERKRAEEALLESEEMQRKILQTVPDLIIRTDLEGTITFVNELAFPGLEYLPAASICGRNIFSVVTEHDLPRAVENARERLEKNIGPQQYQLQLDEGLVVDAEVNGAVIRDKENKAVGMVYVIRDISERLRAEEALKLQKDRYGYILEATNAGTWEWNVQTGETILNERWAEIIGYTLEELAPISIETWIKHSNPDDLACSNALLEHHFNGQSPDYDCECRMRHKDGRWIWVLDRGKVVSWTKDGQPLWMYGTHIDITKRKEMEEALRLSETGLRQLFQESPLSTMLFDKDTGELVDANAAALSAYGCSTLEELRGYDFWSDPPYALADILEWNRKASEEGPQQFHWLSRKISGEYFWEDVFLRRLDIQGKQRIIAVSVDITERKRIEEEREKLQAQLLQAQKMESIGILAGGVAHDFNNLLQAMSGNIELLLQGKTEDHPDTPRLKSVTGTMDRAAQLIRQLLFFSRKAGSRRVLIDLNQEVENVAQILERTIPKMIALELHLAPSGCPLFADPVQLEQILLNLANNSVDAMPEGGRLTVETSNVELDEDFARVHPGSTSGRHVLLTVSDTGCGMDEATLKHVFDPFFTTKEVGKGTGLGLASVYGIVKAHGGYIHCCSEPDQGTTFRIYLPTVEQGCMATVEPQPESSLQGGSETILMVDDELEIRDLTQEALEALGYNVQTAATGEEALEIFKAEGTTVDLVLLDLNMPGMGGHKCLQKLLQIDPTVKVVIASGYTADGHGKGSLSSGARGFIGKPYRLQDLVATVRKVLDEKTSSAQTE